MSLTQHHIRSQAQMNSNGFITEEDNEDNPHLNEIIEENLNENQSGVYDPINYN